MDLYFEIWICIIYFAKKHVKISADLMSVTEIYVEQNVHRQHIFLARCPHSRARNRRRTRFGKNARDKSPQ